MKANGCRVHIRALGARRLGGRGSICVEAIVRGALIALLLAAGYVPPLVSAQSLCESCELQAGIGGTYHFWGTTGGLVLPVTLNWSDNRYELRVFRLSTEQILYDSHGACDGASVLGAVAVTPLATLRNGPGDGILRLRTRGQDRVGPTQRHPAGFCISTRAALSTPRQPGSGADDAALVERRYPLAESWTGLCDTDGAVELGTIRGR
jgi:hypothetical protein